MGKEYFKKPYYFYIKEGDINFSLYYSVQETLTEARTKDEKIDFVNADLNLVKKTILEIAKSKKKYSKADIKKKFEAIKIGKKSKEKEELEEFIDADGTLSTSKIPVLDLKMHPRKTTDQTIPAARHTNNPVMRGFRSYYGESVEDVNEVDYSDAFGYEETKDMDANKTKEYLVKKMGLEPDAAEDRTKQFGKTPNKKKKAPKHIQKRKGFIDRLTLAEREKQEMEKVVEDILTKKYVDTYDVNPKEKREVSKILLKNIKSLKKMANREGLSIRDIIKLFKDE
jgi:hypothetical protein